MSTEKLGLARAERIETQDCVVDRVDTSVDCLVHFADGFALWVENELGAPRMPRVGDTLRLFSRGFGYPVRGVGLVEKGELVALYKYETVEEAELQRRRRIDESNQQKRDMWEAKKEEYAAKVAALPESFRTRVEFFMRRPDWGWTFGPYEIFCCCEAAKIAAKLTLAELVKFHGASVEEQKRMVPELEYSEHSGNTFGAACQFARVFLERPDLLAKYHGALCPLVGCEEYGCFASEVEQ
jgi:hypothetical protein